MESVLEAPVHPPRRGDQDARPRVLVPREHGAYGQLLFPLAVAHLTARPSAAGWLFTVVAIATFIGHEPWLVLLGRRGARAARELGARARRVLALCTAVAVAAMIAGLFAASPAGRQGLLLPALLAPLIAVFVVRNAERTLAGELLVGATLPAFALPIALAGDVEPARALATWAVWTLSSAAAIGSVRSVIAHLKRPANSVQRAAMPLAVLGIAGALSMLHLLDAKAVVALVPTLEVSAVASLLAPHPRHLKSIGWALVAASVITAVLLCL